MVEILTMVDIPDTTKPLEMVDSPLDIGLPQTVTDRRETQIILKVETPVSDMNAVIPPTFLDILENLIGLDRIYLPGHLTEPDHLRIYTL